MRNTIFIQQRVHQRHKNWEKNLASVEGSSKIDINDLEFSKKNTFHICLAY